MSTIGARVLARWEADWFYPGVVVNVSGSDCEIQFDDGDRGMAPGVDVRPINLQVGQSVFGNWNGSGAYYPGKISEIVGFALKIDYNDGDKETTTLSMLRFHREDID